MVVGVDRHHARLVGGLVALADVGGDAEDGERLRPPLRRLHTQGAQRCLTEASNDVAIPTKRT